MNLLLDTEPVVWILKSENKFSKKQQESLEDTNSKRFISIVSLWEISIKVSLQKKEFQLRDDWFKYLKKVMKKYEMKWLPVKQSHCIRQISLPFHHRDPFDRLIISQGLSESASIIGTDPNFKHYKVKMI